MILDVSMKMHTRAHACKHSARMLARSNASHAYKHAHTGTSTTRMAHKPRVCAEEMTFEVSKPTTFSIKMWCGGLAIVGSTLRVVPIRACAHVRVHGCACVHACVHPYAGMHASVHA